MGVTSALVITTVCAVWGVLAGHQLLWIPYTGVAASIVESLTRRWIASPRLGEAQTLSALLKATFALVGIYALVAQFACIVLAVLWILGKQ